MTGPGRGTLILVVGPSGAGKDTLIAAAEAARPDLHVPRRIITRPRDAGEPSCALSEAAFAALRRAGRLALVWRAHGLHYGLRAGIEPRLRSGQSVLANVSRGVIAAACARYAPCRVVLVTAPAPVLAARLAARGREDARGIADRLTRADYPLPEAPGTVTIDNAGCLEAATARFIAALPSIRATQSA